MGLNGKQAIERDVMGNCRGTVGQVRQGKVRDATVLQVICAGVLMVLAACDSSSAEERSEPYAKTAVTELPASWSGFVLESRKPYPATLRLDVDGADVQGVLRVESLNGAVPRLTTADADIPVEGTYDPPVGVLSLTTQSGDRRGELIFDVAVSDVGSVAVASEQRHINGRGAQRARAVFATDRDKKATLERIAVLSAAFEGWRPDMEKGSCPAALAAWRDEALAFQETRRDPVEQYDIFYTDAFRKAFGAPYETVDPERLKQNASLLRGACRPEDRVRGNETNQLAYMIGLGQPHQDHLLWRFESEAASRWVETRSDVLKSDTPMTSAQLNLLDTMWRGIGIGRYGYNVSDLNADIERRKAILRAEENRADMLAFYDRYKDRFDLLIEVARNHANQDEDFLAEVQDKLDTYLEPASEVYARDANNVSEAEYMLAWAVQAGTADLCPLSKPATCRRIGKRFEARVTDMAKDFADALEQAAARRTDRNDRSLEQLATQVTFAGDMDMLYGDLLEIGKLTDSWADVTGTRQQLQKRLAKPLQAELDGLSGADALTGFERRYFFNDDLAQKGVRKIATTLDKRLADEAPFRGLEGGDYLNALVNQDFARLRELDAHYTRGYRPMIALAGASLSMLNPAAGPAMDKELANLSAIHGVFGAYLLNYQDAWPKCLKASDPVFEVTKSQSTVTRDEFGQEISHVTNWTTRDQYKVPASLAGYFQTLWRSDPRTTDARFMDWLLNDRKTNGLVDGLDGAMKQHGCDSPAVRKLEQGMITYYGDVSRRLGRR
ncbi:hypothetical protein PB2503_12259 [Parvularcula bermudensis HTCC2503]|jgi:hypothetical protein|uniref:Uncharacterized protein n=2 Tax=Parvularcula TaxID=208215 RepID=E0TF07_PARBH|nr:hypothetical protein PB2503_12259 [Parvularcula bermudensis HTCC2503]MAP18409.1 hypothetical protein [Aurantimonas sp.]